MGKSVSIDIIIDSYYLKNKKLFSENKIIRNKIE